MLAVVLPLAAAALWGRYAAPRSPRRLPTRSRIVFELGVFAAGAVALAIGGHAVAAAVFAALVVVNAGAMTLFHQWDA